MWKSPFTKLFLGLEAPEFGSSYRLGEDPARWGDYFFKIGLSGKLSCSCNTLLSCTEV
jgi:hypothetical protein